MRRFRPAPRGKVDLRATLRSSMRSGGDMTPLKFKARQTREPPLVVLLDISGFDGKLLPGVPALSCMR
jgi:uncharacterized protein with von Willebrand factor type A (vWA) domain